MTEPPLTTGPPDSPRFSWLALAETVAACAAVVALVRWYDAVWYFAIAATAAPLLLLKTHWSVRTGLDWFAPTPDRIRSGLLRPAEGFDPDKNHLVESAKEGAYYTILTAWALGIKVLATVRNAALHPIDTVRAIPANWLAVCFTVDSRTPLSPIPGLDRFPYYRRTRAADDPPDRLSLVDAVRCGPLAKAVLLLAALWCGAYFGIPRAFPGDDGRPSETAVLVYSTFAVVLMAPYFGPLYLVGSLVAAWWYRWSVKSTALVWSPLVYFSWRAFRDKSTVGRMKDIRHSVWSRILLTYSTGYAVLIVLKYALYFFAYGTLFRLLRLHPLLEALGPYVEPLRISVWQVAGVVNVAIAWYLFIFCDDELRARETGENWSDETGRRVIGWLTFVSGLISVYTVGCFLLITYRIALNRPHFPKEWVLIP